MSKKQKYYSYYEVKTGITESWMINCEGEVYIWQFFIKLKIYLLLIKNLFIDDLTLYSLKGNADKNTMVY